MNEYTQKYVMVDSDTHEIYVNEFGGDLPPMTKQEIILVQTLRYITQIKDAIAHSRRFQSKIAMRIAKYECLYTMRISQHPLVLHPISIRNSTHIPFCHRQHTEDRNQEKDNT